MLNEETPEDLRCTICREVFVNAVTIGDPKCGHSFCSECIRNNFSSQLKRLKRQTACPQCRTLVNHNDSQILIPNRALQEAVSLWHESQNKIISLNNNNNNNQKEEDSKLRNRRKVDYGEDDDNSDENEVIDIIAEQHPSHSLLERRTGIKYTGKKKKQLQELCKNDGLSTQGNEDEVKARHQAFVNFWNAELDSDQPRSPSQLVEEFNQRERARSQERMKDYSTGAINHTKLMKNLHRSLELRGKGKSSGWSTGCLAFDTIWKEAFRVLENSLLERETSKTASIIASKKASTSADTVESEKKPNETLENNVGTFENNANSTPSMLKQTPVEKGAGVNGITNKMDSKISTDNESASKTPKPPMFFDLTGDFNQPKHAGACTLSSTPTASRMQVKCHTPSLSQAIMSVQPQKGTKRDSPVEACNDSSSKRRQNQPRSIAGPWACDACTYFNTVRTYTTANCEMCNTKRNGAAVRRMGVH